MADHAGMLKKLGGNVVKHQQDRYFELRGRYVYYYKRKPVTADEAPQGDIDLRDTVVRDDARNPLAWSISGPALAKEYVLTASSAADKARWVEKLRGWQDTGARKLDSKGGDDDKAESPRARGKMCVDDFEAISMIGQGSFGKVRLVKKKDSGEVYALKAMMKDVILREGLMKHIEDEKSLLSKIDHPFIVKLHWAFQDAERLYLVLEFLSGGELFYHLSQVETFPERQAKFYTAQIATALGHINSIDIIYRDLKPENCVLDKRGNCCITDFGLAKSNVRGATAQTFCGTPEYLAPEFLTGAAHGKAVDWWSLGVLFYEMLYGLPPFYSENVNQMYELILSKALEFEPERAVAEGSKELCRRLLDRDAGSRLQTIDEFMRSACYAEWDFGAMLRGEMEAPFVPDPDKLNFDAEFVRDQDGKRMTVSGTAGGGSNEFMGFTFDGRGDSELGK